VFQIPGWNYYPFPLILDYNYAQDLIFLIKDHMYMMVYSRFDGFYFYGLHEWIDATGGWKEANVLKTGDHTMSRDGDCSVLACNSIDQETGYSVVYGEKNDHLKVFELKKNPNYEGYVDMNNIVCVDAALGFTDGCLLQACINEQKLYALCGKRESCHTKWDACKVLTACLVTKTTKVETCQGDNSIVPPFVNGPRCAVQDGAKWIVLGGTDTDGQFCRDIWILDLTSLQWRRSGQQVPSDLVETELCATQLDSILFVADNKKGIYNFPISEL